MDPWQQYFSKLFPKFLLASEKLEITRSKRNFSKTSYRCTKRDKEIDKLLAQGHIEKLQDFSDRFFVCPVVITVNKDGCVSENSAGISRT